VWVTFGPDAAPTLLSTHPVIPPTLAAFAGYMVADLYLKKPLPRDIQLHHLLMLVLVAARGWAGAGDGFVGLAMLAEVSTIPLTVRNSLAALGRRVPRWLDVLFAVAFAATRLTLIPTAVARLAADRGVPWHSILLYHLRWPCWLGSLAVQALFVHWWLAIVRRGRLTRRTCRAAVASTDPH
jgi:hypothetical protein